VATRSEIKADIRALLGTTIDDPLYGDTAGAGLSPTLDPIVQEAVDSLIEDIYASVPAYAPKVAVLAASATTDRTYPLVSQTPPIADFSHWLKVRFDNEDGGELDECAWDQLGDVGFGFFAVVGADEQAVIETSRATDAGHPLWLQYGFRPADLANDAAQIPLIPRKYHYVVALEALFAFELGAESVLPPELRQRWITRRAALLARVGKRGPKPRRTRLDPAVWASYQ